MRTHLKLASGTSRSRDTNAFEVVQADINPTGSKATDALVNLRVSHCLCLGQEIQNLKKALFVLLAFWSNFAIAQSNQAFQQKSYWASDYGTWSIPSQAANTYQWPIAMCRIPIPDAAGSFFPFNVNAQVLIADADPTKSEVVTVTGIIQNQAFCGIQISPVRQHVSFTIGSATAGLQEVLNQIPGAVAYPAQVILDRNWYAALSNVPGATGSAVIAAAKGSTAAYLADQTQAPYAFYVWSGSAYVLQTPGSGPPSGAAGGVLGCTYPDPCLNASGVTLPNGSTATTQATADSSTKVATDAFVLANGGGPPTGAAGNALNGTYPDPGFNTNYLNGSNLSPAIVNTKIYVDGVNGQGIGQAQVAYNSANNYQQCQAASYSGGNYIAVTFVPAGIGPSGNPTYWQPEPNSNTPTQWDCALAVANSKDYSISGVHVGADLIMGENYYTTCIGAQFPTVAAPGYPTTSVHGGGHNVSFLRLACSIPQSAMWLLPDSQTAYYLASFEWAGFTLDANFLSQNMNVYGAQQFRMKDIYFLNPLPGSDHVVEFGDPNGSNAGWTYEATLEDLYIGSYRGGGSGASITATVSGGVPTFTIVSGGSGYTQSQVVGYLATTGGRLACSSPGTTTVTITSGAVTGFTSTATGCNATTYPVVYGNINVAYGMKFTNFTDSHLISGLTNGGVGQTACFEASNITGANTFLKTHPIDCKTGIIDSGNNNWIATQQDTSWFRGFDFEGSDTNANVNDTFFEWANVMGLGAADYYFGTTTNPPTNAPRSIFIDGDIISNAPPTGYAHFSSASGVVDTGNAMPTFVHSTKPNYANAPYLTSAITPDLVAQNLVWSNGDYQASTGIPNNWTWNMGSGGNTALNLWGAPLATGANTGVYALDLANPTAATSGQNYKSPVFGVFGTYLSSASASVSFGVNQQLTFGTGANPTATYGFHASGTVPASLTYSFDNPVVLPTGSTGVTQTATDNTTKLATDAFVQSNISALGSIVANPSAAQAVTQPTSTTLSVNNLNNRYYVDGFTTAGYPGIGVAQTAWSSGTYGLCTAVSYSGSNYLAVGTPTTTTPGTNSAVWYPVPDANVPTQTYCAVYYTLAQALAAGTSYDLYFGDNTFTGPYVTNGSLVLQNGQSHVSLHGAGRGFNTQHTTIQAGSTFPASTWMVTTPTYTGSTPYNLVVEGINFDGNFLAYGCFQFYGEKLFRYEHLGCINWNPSSASARPMSVGSPSDSPGGYQGIINDVFIAGGTGATRATVTVALGSGSPVFTVSAGGAYKYNTGKVLFWGFGSSSTATQPCTTMGTATPTFTGSAGSYVLASIAASGFSGCSGTGYAYVPDITAAQYAVDVSNITDSTFKDLVVANAGYQYGIFYNGVGASVMTHEHVYSQSQIEILDGHENTHVGAELDDIAQEGAATGPGTTFIGTIVASPGALAPRAGVYEFGGSGAANIINSSCPNTSTSAGPFFLAVGASGPIPHGGNFSPFSVVNGEECDTLTTENSFTSGLVVPGVTSSQVISAPNVSSAMTVASPVTAATYYVDNINGSDSNNGTSQATPWKTIAHVNAATIASGAQVLFLSTDVWHEQITMQSAGITYGPYGPARQCSLNSSTTYTCTNMPIIDGSDVVTTWTLVTGSTYSSPYTSTATKGFVDSLYADTTPLALQTSLGNVESTPGSIYSNGTLVYVNLLDGSNPTAHTIEVAGARSYGISGAGFSNLTVKGLEIIRTSLDGINVNPGGAQTVTNFIADSNYLFNTQSGAPSGGVGQGAIVIFGNGFGSPAVLTGIQITNNRIGRMDLSQSISFLAGGIAVFSATSPIIKNNYVATVNTNGIEISDYFNAANDTCTGAIVTNNEVVANQSGISFKGCPNVIAQNNFIHNGSGFGIGVANGIQTGTISSGATLAGNRVMYMGPGYGTTNYNGIDVNAGSTNGIASGNYCFAVAAGCMTLEADGAPSTGWQVYGNTFDVSQGTGYNGSAPTSGSKAYPMYVRDTSLSGGLTMRANNFVYNATTPIIRFGATSAGDTTHDLTQAQFDADYPWYEIEGPNVSAAQYSTLVATITASATPAIVATNGLQKITLSANATPTITGIAAGQRTTFQICQPASGGPYTWTWPAAIHGGVTIGTTASTCSMQSFDSFTGTTMVPESTGVINIAP